METSATSVTDDKISATMGETFELAINDIAYIESADLLVHFVNVTEDSRCPSDVQCIWAGQVTVVIELRQNSTNTELGNLSLTMSGASNPPTSTIEGYKIKLLRVDPYPISTRPLQISDYRVTLLISYESVQPIILTAVSVGNLTEAAYEAKITWTPANLGQPNKFHVEMFDPNQLEPRLPKCITYDIKIYKGEKYLLPPEPMSNNAQLNEDCSQDFTFVFLDGGSYVLAIEEIEHEGENIEIPIQVTPEFPLGILAIMAGIFTSMIALRRITSLRTSLI
jgi:hypothetical protein